MRSEGWAWVVLVSVLAGPAQAASPGPSPVVDGVAAAIGYEVVPRSLLVAYRGAFLPRADEGVALAALIDERLLGAEARRYGLAPDERAVAQLLAQQPVPPGFQAEEWRQVLTDRVLAGQLLAFRFGDYVPIGREAIEAYLVAHPQPASVGREAREASARAALLPEARARREAAFKAELRSRAEVRLMAPRPSPE
ncbi:MAG: hypothetical protein VKS61_06960 [Candidatus Sericytochromatia bacterium]|nr:hypothetical protein [Candidatus Sericytochromatia bacterium]